MSWEKADPWDATDPWRSEETAQERAHLDLSSSDAPNPGTRGRSQMEEDGEEGYHHMGFSDEEEDTGASARGVGEH